MEELPLVIPNGVREARNLSWIAANLDSPFRGNQASPFPQFPVVLLTWASAKALQLASGFLLSDP
jgi:hypothetical protein